MKQKNFEYETAHLEHLRGKDKKLGKAMDKLGAIRREVGGDLFAALVYSVIGQQVSGAAAESISKRLKAKAKRISAKNIHELGIDGIKSCGLSMRKAQYVFGIAEAVLEKRVNFAKIKKMSDADAVAELVKLKGVGVWTAEMLLIFALRRPDIFSEGDYGIKKGIMKLYGLENVDKKTHEKLRKKYSPYGTLASLYLWEIASSKEF